MNYFAQTVFTVAGTPREYYRTAVERRALCRQGHLNRLQKWLRETEKRVADSINGNESHNIL